MSQGEGNHGGGAPPPYQGRVELPLNRLLHLTHFQSRGAVPPEVVSWMEVRRGLSLSPPDGERAGDSLQTCRPSSRRPCPVAASSDPSFRFCPAGTPENSPAIHRWVTKFRNPLKPRKGRKNLVAAKFFRPWRDSVGNNSFTHR